MQSSWRWYTLSAIIIGLLLTISSCDTQQSVGIQDSLDVVADLTLIDGAENSTITVNKGSSSYFSLDLSNISENNHIQEGKGQKGWCVLWDKPIESNNSRYEGLALYSTFGDEKWKPVNYLLNVKSGLELQDPDLTYLEIQAAIWALRDYPEFSTDLPIDRLPSRLVRDGKPNFDKAKVDQIVSHVKQNYESFQYDGSSTYAVIAETPSDTQTIIIEVDQSVWAYGQISFRSQEFKDAVGARGQGNGRWGWVFELDSDFVTTELIAGGGSDDGTKSADEVGTIIGSLDMSKSGNDLDITYSPFNGYLVNDLHLWVGCSLNDFPTAGNSGNPSLNNFQYTYSDDPEDSKTFSVDLSDISCSEIVFISAHAGGLYTVEYVEMPINETPQFVITNLREYGLDRAADINNLGDIVGGEFLWKRQEQSLLHTGFNANKVNDKRQILGTERVIGENFVRFDDAIWSEIEGTQFITFEDYYDLSNDEDFHDTVFKIYDFNNEGYVAGWVYNDVYWPVYDPETGDEIGYIGYDFGQGFVREPSGELRLNDILNRTINDENELAGTGDGYFEPVGAYLDKQGSRPINIGSFERSDSEVPTAINNKAEIVGTARVFQGKSSVYVVIGPDNKEIIKSHERNLDRLMPLDKLMDLGQIIELKKDQQHDLLLSNQSEQKSKTNTNQSTIVETALEWINNVSYNSEPFFWSVDTGMFALGTLGGSWATPWDINDHSQVVGYSSIGNGEHRAFYWDEENGMIELPSYGGNSEAKAINNEGQIVGYSYDSYDERVPVMWEITNGEAKIASN